MTQISKKLEPCPFAWAAIRDGSIVIETISPTIRAARINFLVVHRKLVILQSHSDEQIEEMWNTFKGDAEIEQVAIRRRNTRPAPDKAMREALELVRKGIRKGYIKDQSIIPPYGPEATEVTPVALSAIIDAALATSPITSELAAGIIHEPGTGGPGENTDDKLKIGAFYWVIPTFDPDTEEQWEGELQPARLAGRKDDGTLFWHCLNIEGHSDWPTCFIGAEIKM